MLRLTTTVYQVMSDANVVVSVHQEDPYDGTSTLLGDVRTTYDLSHLLDQYDELTALLVVLAQWARSSVSRQLDEALARSGHRQWD